ncbi:hypothetical protein [Acidovorax sp. Root217]|uniref:hypothetical protein n=1 Tax=Acidovorax sp. Root217 TaxID=1736492 RepID=UPI0012F73EF4|nr:hypothetical protein [Acidovorax sp. Root217]
MKFLRSITLLAALTLASSACIAQLVGVVVTPDGYEVGGVQWKLATPAVDEVVRLSPTRVLILFCTTTPPAKIIQFETELEARHKVPVQLASWGKACPDNGSQTRHWSDPNRLQVG